MKKILSVIASTSLLTLTSAQTNFLPPNFATDFANTINLDNSGTPSDTQGVINFPTTNIFSNPANDLSTLSLDLPSIQLNLPTDNTATNTETTTIEETSEQPETVSEEEQTSQQPEEQTLPVEPTTPQENQDFEDFTELPTPVIEGEVITSVLENENTPLVIPGGFDFGEGVPIVPEESGDIAVTVAENNDLSGLFGNTIENSIGTAGAQPSTIKCDFNEFGQLQCQTCYYQAGCFGLDCPIDHCE